MVQLWNSREEKKDPGQWIFEGKGFDFCYLMPPKPWGQEWIFRYAVGCSKQISPIFPDISKILWVYQFAKFSKLDSNGWNCFHVSCSTRVHPRRYGDLLFLLPVLKNGDRLSKLSYGFPKLRFLMYIVLNFCEGLIRIRSSICSTLSMKLISY